MTKVDPNVAVEVMREIIGKPGTQKKRAFLGAFIERVVLQMDVATVDYRPDGVIRAGSKTSVRSGCRWLLDLGSNQGPVD